METKHKIELAVTHFLHSTPDIDSLTEQHVRSLVSDNLGIDLSGLPHKILVRHLIQSFLLSLPADSAADGEVLPAEEVVNGGGSGGALVGASSEVKRSSDDSCRVICKVGTLSSFLCLILVWLVYRIENPNL